MSNKIGHCACCECKIMIQDVNGKWCKNKSNFRKAYITFESGLKVKTTLCDACLKPENIETIVTRMHDCNSENFSKASSDYIKASGPAISISERA